jgi:hypothetical protein
MKKIVFTVAVLSLALTLIGIFPHGVASRSQTSDLLAHTPGPVAAGGSLATAIGLVGAPTDLAFALRGGGTSDFWQYSISRNAWTILPNTPAPVGDGAAIVQIHSYTFCTPGTGKYCLAALRGDNTTDFWIFDIKANSWCEGPNTPAAVGPGGAIAQLQASGEIYALRGGGTSDFWKFERGVWTALANAPGPVNAGGGLVGINYGTHSPRTGGLLYAIQGGGSTAVWKYQGDTDTWTHQADTPAPIGPGGAVATSNVGSGANGTLVILQGGGSTKVWALDVEIEGNIWRDINNAPTSITTGGAISGQVNGCDFALVGGGSDQFFSTGLRNCFIPTPQSDFSLSFEQPTVTLTRGTKIKVRLNITRTSEFTGKITLSPPAEKFPGIVVPADFILPEADSVSFKIKAKGSAEPGTYQLSFVGKDDSGKNRPVTLTLSVQ